MTRNLEAETFLPDVPDGAMHIRRILKDAGHQAVFVGGCVRDTLLGRTAADWDIGTSARPEDSMRLFLHHGLQVIPTGLPHGTVTVLWDGAGYEVTVFRQDGSYSDGRRPDSVSFTHNLEHDLARRDFTMNAIAWDPEEGLIDPYGGRADIAARRIRTVGDPEHRFAEDSLRMMRAVRFAGRLGFDIDPETLAAVCRHASDLVKVSAERISSELVQTAASSNPAALRLFRETGLLEHFLPELNDAYSRFTRSGESIGEHCVQVSILSPPTLIARIAGLLHDLARDPSQAGEPDDHAARSAEQADTALRRLRFMTRDRERIVWLISQHDRSVPENLPRLRRFLADAGPDRWEDWISLVKADILANQPVDMKARLDSLESMADRIHEIHDAAEPLSVQELAVDGTDALQAGFRGQEIGAALSHCLDRVLDNPMANTKDKLLEALQQYRTASTHS